MADDSGIIQTKTLNGANVGLVSGGCLYFDSLERRWFPAARLAFLAENNKSPIAVAKPGSFPCILPATCSAKNLATALRPAKRLA
jgi:hypothetical protein